MLQMYAKKREKKEKEKKGKISAIILHFSSKNWCLLYKNPLFEKGREKMRKGKTPLNGCQRYLKEGTKERITHN